MYSKGICWFDDCRIPFVNESDSFTINKLEYQGKDWYKEGCEYKGIKEKNTKGRFPANLLVSDDMLNDGVITKQSQRTYKPTDKSASLFGNSPQAHGVGIGDKGSNSRYYDIDKWFNNLIDG
jgi:hypothetical protein